MSGLTDREGIKENQPHFWGEDPGILSNSSSAEDFAAGNGLTIYKSTLLPALETAEHEIILVTCFWAASDTLNSLSSTLINLSNRCLARPHGSPKLRVWLCLSSRSFFSEIVSYLVPGRIYLSAFAMGLETRSSASGATERPGSADQEHFRPSVQCDAPKIHHYRSTSCFSSELQRKP